MPTAAPANTSRLLDYLRLMRLPNVFTALGDVLMGYLFVRGGFFPPAAAAGDTAAAVAPLGSLFCLLAASACLYTAGMVLNDVFDLEVDRLERPMRPLPSGRIALALAQRLGYGLLLAGVASAAVAGYVAAGRGAIAAGHAWRPLLVAFALAVCILAYNGGLKHTLLGPWTMGTCRLLNVWLGMSLDPAAQGWSAWRADGWCAAGAIGLYIVGVTWFARGEAARSRRGGLLLGAALMLAGWILLGMLPWASDRVLSLAEPMYWVLMLVMLALPLVRRCATALYDPSPQRVQAAVKHGILSLIMMDAAVALQVAKPLNSLVILALLIPMLALARRVYST